MVHEIDDDLNGLWLSLECGWIFSISCSGGVCYLFEIILIVQQHRKLNYSDDVIDLYWFYSMVFLGYSVFGTLSI